MLMLIVAKSCYVTHIHTDQISQNSLQQIQIFNLPWNASCIDKIV